MHKIDDEKHNEHTYNNAREQHTHPLYKGRTQCTRLSLYGGSGRGKCRLALPPFMKRLLPSLEPETYRSWAKALVIAPSIETKIQGRGMRQLKSYPKFGFGSKGKKKLTEACLGGSGEAFRPLQQN
ncbi:hypothetical protein DVH24_024618 [Malus domestica]|uniref:Uncharacterized protein n=1 Tax=Malus domestica TaxID=3750 RepID=A0A498JM12_MALDO|nr:hypothetical protein DVH24_024618 [Malus domestica]